MIRLKLAFLSWIVLCAVYTVQAQNVHSKTTLYPTYKGLVMAGYQGWFRAAGDGTSARGYSYGNEKQSSIDMWPDVTEYEKTYETPFKNADGKPSRMFSSADKSTVDLHFKWMQQYGVDGVFMQRFYGNVKARDKESSAIIQNAFEAASKYKRAIAVMYDLSGLNPGEDCSAIIEDWKYMVDQIKVTNQSGTKTYLHENGKPVVCIWGAGFPDRPYNIRNIGLDRLIDFLKNDPVYGGCAVMLGVPNSWRTLRADCVSDPYLHQLIKQCDIVLPWAVQRYSPLLHNDIDRYRDDIIDDIKWCRENNLEYVPCVYPGFSWHNLSLHAFPDDIKPNASIPRQGGRFYWQMMSTAMSAGASMLYVAMFDEINEGTAIFKVTDHPPVTPAGNGVHFTDLEGVPSDRYLWLTGEAAKMLKREKPLVFKMPVQGASK
ncbi:glycoside hydrolase family 71/99-like protein [Mucilaginibacter jinjuensis]|uniref:Glycoside hydrolase family 71/99-like protein n=1 Tax=Mucilaginibacter jinjuensis TaxID=1176721 RepID=A0ABY7T3W4_9SPHI|nr:glycoside hydrolase family 71/99-like protein [Mucilaginibacter jinjuensis]WCT10416.1 glycoside hydrolase family 71/99-like protein [Mucilaginibacter jinjuensis]